MSDPFLALDAAADLRSHPRSLRGSWEAPDPGDEGGVRPVVGASWRRVRELGVAVDGDPACARPADEVGDLLEASPLRPALEVLRGHLDPVTADAEHVMVVSDAEGMVLWFQGADGLRRRAEEACFTPGWLWSEASAGTNAIGTALAIDRPLHVSAAEHLRPGLHTWWCAAAPIHHPHSGELLGVVDLSGPLRTAHPHSLLLVRAAAALAEERLRDVLVPPVGPLRLEVLGRGPATVRLGDGRARTLGARHAEILALLAAHPAGLSAKELTVALYGDLGNCVSVRAEMSRLRKLLGPALCARPYRLEGEVSADFLDVGEALRRGDVPAALRSYGGLLLPESEAPGIARRRDELDAAVGRTARQAAPRELWRWLESDPGRDDPDALARFIRLTHVQDPRRALAAARLRAIQVSWRS